MINETPLSRSEAYEAIIAEESQLESQTQTTTNMENTQETQNSDSVVTRLEAIRSLASQATDMINHLENIIHNQKLKIAELESKPNNNVISRKAIREIVEIIDGLASSQVESELEDQYISIQFGDYSDDIKLSSIVNAPSIYIEVDDVITELESNTDFRVS